MKNKKQITWKDIKDRDKAEKLITLGLFCFVGIVMMLGILLLAN